MKNLSIFVLGLILATVYYANGVPLGINIDTSLPIPIAPPVPSYKLGDSDSTATKADSSKEVETMEKAESAYYGYYPYYYGGGWPYYGYRYPLVYVG